MKLLDELAKRMVDERQEMHLHVRQHAGEQFVYMTKPTLKSGSAASSVDAHWQSQRLSLTSR